MAMFKQGESTWTSFWRNQTSHGPTIAELRVDIKSIGDINIDDDTFTSRFLVYVRVPCAALYDTQIVRKVEPGAAFVVAPSGSKIEEYSPWLEFDGTIKSKSSWTRTRGSEFLVYCYDVEASFSTGDKSSGTLYPFDYHTLGIKITSNWDSKELLFAPWGSHWTEDEANGTLHVPVSVVDEKCCRFRNTLRGKTIGHVWKHTLIPRLLIASSDGFTGRFVYSNATVSVFVSRRLSYHSVYELIRPFALAALGPLALVYIADTSSRVTYSVSLIVAMSFAFVTTKNRRITFSDYYRLLMFIFAATNLIFAINPNGGNILYQVGSWGMFLLFHGILGAALAVAYPARFREWTTHRSIRGNTLVGLGLVDVVVQGAKSLTKGKTRKKNETDIVRNQAFGDDD